MDGLLDSYRMFIGLNCKEWWRRHRVSQSCRSASHMGGVERNCLATRKLLFPTMKALIDL